LPTYIFTLITPLSISVAFWCVQADFFEAYLGLLLLNRQGLASHPAPYEFSYNRLLPNWSDLGVAFATIYWAAFSRLKGDFAFLATLDTYRGMHLSAPSGASGVVVLGPLCLTASRATLGLVGISPAGVELLFLGGEGEFGTTVSTL
jgi:hypothetical protein